MGFIIKNTYIRTRKVKRLMEQCLEGNSELPCHLSWSQGHHPLGTSMCSPTRKLHWTSCPEFLLGFLYKGMIDEILTTWLNPISSPALLSTPVLRLAQLQPSNHTFGLSGDLPQSWSCLGAYHESPHKHKKILLSLRSSKEF